MTDHDGIVLVRTDRHGHPVHWLKTNWNGTARRSACGKNRRDDTEGGGVICIASVDLVLACKRCDDLLHGRTRPRTKRQEGGLFD